MDDGTFGWETRRSILDAAHELFVANGYAATTIQAIAERAGVAVQTVYAVFGNKRELLRQLIESTITGDDEAAPIVRVVGEAAASPVVDYGWSPERYEGWLAWMILETVLVTPEHARQPASATAPGRDYR